MERRIVAVGLLLLSVLCVSSRTSSADPVTITGGHLEMNGFTGTLFLLGDRGFTLSANVSVTDGVFAPWLTCNLAPACVPGTTIGLDATFTGSSLRSATAMLDGRSFDNVGGLSSTTAAAVRFTGSAQAPVFGTDTAMVLAPFLLAGTFSGLNAAGGPVHLTFAGHGTATLSLRRNPAFPSWSYTAASYAIHPVPEPATILLTAAGLWGLARRRSRRRGAD